MKAILFTVLLSLAVFAQERAPAAVRKSAPSRAPVLFTQGETAQGLWWDGQMVGVIGWNGSAVPAGSQVVLKGRGFVGHESFLILHYSLFSDLGEVMIIAPRVEMSVAPEIGESIGFDLPVWLRSRVTVQGWADGALSNEVGFVVE